MGAGPPPEPSESKSARPPAPKRVSRGADEELGSSRKPRPLVLRGASSPAMVERSRDAGAGAGAGSAPASSSMRSSSSRSKSTTSTSALVTAAIAAAAAGDWVGSGSGRRRVWGFGIASRSGYGFFKDTPEIFLYMYSTPLTEYISVVLFLSGSGSGSGRLLCPQQNKEYYQIGQIRLILRSIARGKYLCDSE